MTDQQPAGPERPEDRPEPDGLPPRFVGNADEVVVTLPTGGADG